MTLGIARPGASPLHRLGAGPKLLALLVAGTGLFFVDSLAGIALACGAVVGLATVSGIPASVLAAELRPVRVVVLVVLLAQAILAGPAAGVVAAGRLLALVVLAALVTLTTPAAAMIAALTRALRPLAAFGVDPRRVGFAISLTLRFIPTLAQITAEVQEAQRARGLERSLVAVAVPVVVRTLKMADDIADAAEARGFPSTADARRNRS